MENQINLIKNYFIEIGIKNPKFLSELSSDVWIEFDYKKNHYTTNQINKLTLYNVKIEINKLINLKNHYLISYTHYNKFYNKIIHTNPLKYILDLNITDKSYVLINFWEIPPIYI